MESFWGPSSQLYSFLEAQRVSKKVFERSMKKRCEKKAASDAGDARDRGQICRMQTADQQTQVPHTSDWQTETETGNHSTACPAARWRIYI